MKLVDQALDIVGGVYGHQPSTCRRGWQERVPFKWSRLGSMPAWSGHRRLQGLSTASLVNCVLFKIFSLAKEHDAGSKHPCGAITNSLWQQAHRVRKSCPRMKPVARGA